MFYQQWNQHVFIRLSTNGMQHFILSDINNNNLLHLHSAFLGTQSAFHTRGESPQPPMCAASTWTIRRQPYCARTTTTHQFTGGDRVMKPIGVWKLLGGHDDQKPTGKFGQDARVTPLLYFEGHPGILNDHRESGPRFNVSSKGRCFFIV